MASTTQPGYVILHVRDLHSDGPFPQRRVILTSPDWFVKIGRGNMTSDEGLIPSLSNTTFDSRVMSRNHAIFSANPETKEIFVTDVGSMHGTHLAGRRLKTEEPAKLSPQDIITLGADVSRGPSFYKPVKVSVDWTWYENDDESLNDNPASTQPTRNSFSAEYSDEDAYGSDVDPRELNNFQEHTGLEQEVVVAENALGEKRADTVDEDEEEDAAVNAVEDSFCFPRVEVTASLSRTFSVPDSDSSDVNSYVSSSEDSNIDSPTSSPVNAAQVVEGKEVAPQYIDMGADIPAQTAQADYEPTATPGFSKTDPADVIMWSSGCLDAIRDGRENDANSGCPLPTEADPLGPRPIRSALEELPKTTRLDTLALPQDRVHAHRAPSPSDAAMAKSSTSEMPRAPPFVQSSATTHETFPADYPETRSISAWAGHNSVLYDFHTGPPTGCVKETPPWHREWAGSSPCTALTLPPLDPNRVLAVAEPVPASAGNHVLKPEQSHKRKADHLSSDNLSVHTADEFLHLWETAKPDPDLVNDAGAEAREESPSSSPLADIPVQSTEIDDQPARKKVKTGVVSVTEPRGNGTSDAVKLVVAAIAGVAIGAVGTVIGLAALPPLA
ncbi:hypothetical protein PV08_10793 [Exophiala spinifera]|uniref:FHA domain-containing protein n=1 Tax=Exophiala spinifera TaxID=91928 RepID=A0A0D2AXU5_9EURO|nr:uncharacterized protein PV08_10793 [Exophiala spinifera]KIW11493.1 hypothetical protein PV08_10793 [Exophiala spinifera]